MIRRATPSGLSRAKLNDQLGLNGDGNIIGGWQPAHDAFRDLRITAGQKIGDIAGVFGKSAANKIKALGAVDDSNDIGDANLVAGDRNALAIHGDVAVANHLPSLRAAL